MDTLKLKILLAFREKRLLSEEEIAELKEQIPLYKYPVGLIYFILQDITAQLRWQSYPECHNYVSTIINSLYTDYYTSDELDIISISIALYLSDFYIFNDEWRAQVAPVLDTNSEKIEVMSLLNDIKYQYTLSLIVKSTVPASDILPYISQLESGVNLPLSELVRQQR